MSLQDKINKEKRNQLNESPRDTLHNKIGTNLQQTHINSDVIENLQKQNDLLMKRLVEIEQRENEREQKHNQLLKSLEVSTSNFNKATEDTKDNFMTVAGSYLRKIKSDNLEQDFNKALNQQFESIDNKTNQLLKALIMRIKSNLKSLKTIKK